MKKRQAGQALIMVTFSLSVMLGMIGLSVDLGWSYYRRQAAQTAAESAALAASLATMTNTTITCSNSVCQAATACPANPTGPPANNIASGCLYAKANGFVNAGQQTVQIASNLTTPPTAPGVSALYWVTATITEQNSQLFSGMLGNHTFGSILAQATAGVFQGSVSNCVYVLDPHASSALFVQGSSTLLTTSCGVYVNSNSASSITVNGNGHVNAAVIDSVGGYATCTNGQDCFYYDPTATFPRLPLTSQPTVTDPYASLPAPSYSGCGTFPNGSASALTISQGSQTLGPGVYCGGINVQGNAQVTLGSGVYILNGGGLQLLSANATVTGSGVMFYNTANGQSYGPVVFSGQPNVNLTAPVSGTYAGVLFYQDRTITSTSQNVINGASNPNMVGSFYFPTTPLLITGGSNTTPFHGRLVSRTLQINGNGMFISLSGDANAASGSAKFSALIQ